MQLKEIKLKIDFFTLCKKGLLLGERESSYVLLLGRRGNRLESAVRAAVLKQKALGAEVGCKNALFEAVAKATNKIVSMPQTVCRGKFARHLCLVLPPGFATVSYFFYKPPPLLLQRSVRFFHQANRKFSRLYSQRQ
ncbi:MAG: hypothetical protein PUI24_09765 [Spirochaetales bacterium]|nr:hypothetical protein [Spirochaetales bacterium]